MVSVLVATAFLLPQIVVIYILWTFLRLIVRQSRSPLRHLRGPASPSFFMGNLREMYDMENTNLVGRWQEQHGSTFVYRGFLGGRRLMTTDPAAVAHILGRAYDYPKPDFVRDNLASMAAGKEGLLTVEGEHHRRQRKILLREIWLKISHDLLAARAPSDPFSSSLQHPETHKNDFARTTANSTSSLPNPFSSFVPSKAAPRRLKRAPDSTDSDYLEKDLTPRNTDPISALQSSSPRVDTLAWLARATLDVIGEAGFGYSFNSLSAAAESSADESELAQAFDTIFATARKFRALTVLQVWFPILRKIRKDAIVMKEARATMQRIGLSLIEERRLAIMSQKTDSAKGSSTRALPPVDRANPIMDGHRDLLGILIRSNLASEASQRLSVSEILCQISTFIAAGHETTSSAMSWTLFALAQAPHIQQTLRSHLRSIPFEDADTTDLSSHSLLDSIFHCEYLDHVVREALRLHAPVTSTMRVAGADDIIPVARPFLDRYGHVHTRIQVKKGDIITVPIQAMNKDPEVWGDDAAEFLPERWAETASSRAQGAGSLGEPKQSRRPRKAGAPGLWSDILTFLNGNPINGNRACIGFQFAINEIKIFLFVLLRDIEFSVDPLIEIEKKVNVVARPWVKSEPHMGNQMPLNLRSISLAPQDVIDTLVS